MTHEEIVEQLDQICDVSNFIMRLTDNVHPGTVVGACAMAAGSIGTVCAMSKEEFMNHIVGMVGQAWDRQLEMQEAQAKERGPLQ